MSEYIIDMGNSSYQSTNGLLCVDVSQLRDEVVRCRDCIYMSDDGLTTAWCNENCREVRPLDFCAWGERRGE